MNIKNNYDLVIIGAGPAGLSLAAAAWDAGIRDLLLLERSGESGGILNQCIHHGFGQQVFGEELTGPAYAERLAEEISTRGIEVLTHTTALRLDPGPAVTLLSPTLGMRSVKARAVVLANGCRERTREAVTLPGTRCAGIYCAGTAQYLMNMEGVMPGRRVVILGSGDIGLIMARRLTLEGAQVLAVLEKNDYPGGLQRNIQQCLRDFHIPLLLSTTVTGIRGRERVEAVEVAGLDGAGQVVEQSRRTLPCDTLLLSVGLLPETDIAFESGMESCPATGGPLVDERFATTLRGVFACGNVAYVHNLVDTVTLEARAMAAAVADYLGGRAWSRPTVEVRPGPNVLMTVPQRLCLAPGKRTIVFRVARPMEHARVTAADQNGRILGELRRIKLWPSEAEELTLGGDLIGVETLTVSAEGGVL